MKAMFIVSNLFIFFGYLAIHDRSDVWTKSLDID